MRLDVAPAGVSYPKSWPPLLPFSWERTVELATLKVPTDWYSFFDFITLEAPSKLRRTTGTRYSHQRRKKVSSNRRKVWRDTPKPRISGGLEAAPSRGDRGFDSIDRQVRGVRAVR